MPQVLPKPVLISLPSAVQREVPVPVLQALLNMQDCLWDGIKRDRLVWIGDMHPETMSILAVFGAVVHLAAWQMAPAGPRLPALGRLGPILAAVACVLAIRPPPTMPRPGAIGSNRQGHFCLVA